MSKRHLLLSTRKGSTALLRVKRLSAVLLGATLLTGCSSLGGGSKAAQTNAARIQQSPNLGVNAFLWRASLETLDFMPLDSVDPFGGVIITDWYASPEAPDERFKANVFILDTNPRADALKASVFKQVRSGGAWADASIDQDTNRQIENSILTRARELFIATVDSQ